MAESGAESSGRRPASRVGPGRLRPYCYLLALQVLLGVATGLIWLAWAPRTTSYVLADQANRPIIVPAESESQIAGDGRFFVLAVIAGLVVGLVAWFGVRRHRGPATLGWLSAGGVLSALVAAWLGHLLAPGHDSGALQTAIRPRLSLHAWPMLFVQALTAAGLYSALTGFTADEALVEGSASPAGNPAAGHGAAADSDPAPGAGPRDEPPGESQLSVL